MGEGREGGVGQCFLSKYVVYLFSLHLYMCVIVVVCLFVCFLCNIFLLCGSLYTFYFAIFFFFFFFFAAFLSRNVFLAIA